MADVFMLLKMLNLVSKFSAFF